MKLNFIVMLGRVSKSKLTPEHMFDTIEGDKAEAPRACDTGAVAETFRRKVST